MHIQRTPFTSPYFDTYQIGFTLHDSQTPNWRQRTIAGVSFNGLDREAYFFNPDKLVLPLEMHPYELPKLLGRQALDKSFGVIEGIGQFAIKAAQLSAMPDSVRSRWVTYWLIEPNATYANDAATWAKYVDARRMQALDGAEALACMPDSMWPTHLRRTPLVRENAHFTPSERPSAVFELEQARAVYLQNLAKTEEQNLLAQAADDHSRQCETDKRINAWLRGEASSPPLLAQMQCNA